MIDKDEKISKSREADIIDRVNTYLKKHEITQSVLARETNVSKGTVSDVLRGVYGKRGKGGVCTSSEYARRFNNWMELHARRQNIVSNRKCVMTSVAQEIKTVVQTVAETCAMGLIYGPSHIGKTFTLQSLDGSDRLGQPIYIRINRAHRTPVTVCRLILETVGEKKLQSTFDRLARRLFSRFNETGRLFMFDEADRLSYDALEFIRDFHDATGCGVLLAGKPVIYQKFGYREIGSYTEVTDQLASRVVIRRDLTERTRTIDPKNPNKKPEMLFSKEDILKIIDVSNIGIAVDNDAVDWLQERASRLGMGGLGIAVMHLYLAVKIAVSKNYDSVTKKVLEQVERHTIGGEETVIIKKVLDDKSKKAIGRLA